MSSSIRIDATRQGVVIHCTKCGHWAAFRFTKAEAWDAACAHERAVHPDEHHQRDAAEQRRSRHRISGM